MRAFFTTGHNHDHYLKIAAETRKMNENFLFYQSLCIFTICDFYTLFCKL